MALFPWLHLFLCIMDRYAGGMQWVSSRLADIDVIRDKVESPSHVPVYVIRLHYGQGTYVGKMHLVTSVYAAWIGYDGSVVEFADIRHRVEVLVQEMTDQCVWRPFDASDPSEMLPTEAVQGGQDDAGRLIYVGRGGPARSWTNQTGGYIEEERTLYVTHGIHDHPNMQFDLLLCSNDDKISSGVGVEVDGSDVENDVEVMMGGGIPSTGTGPNPQQLMTYALLALCFLAVVIVLIRSIIQKRGCQYVPSLPVRYQVSIMSCWGLANFMAMRVNLDVALVSMVNYTHEQFWNTSDTCPQMINTTSTQTEDGEFEWDLPTQSLLLAAFSYGYPFLQLPGGLLAERYGARRVFGVSIFLAGICTLLSPLAARWHPTVLIVLRVLLGLVGGPIFPAHHVLWSRWAPPLERGKLMGFSFMGDHLGLLFSLGIASLCDSSHRGGWSTSFYIFGGVTCLWFCLWMLLVSDSPATNSRISLPEREYIQEATQNIHLVKHKVANWRSVLSSAKVWALLITQWCNEMAIHAVVHSSALYFKQLFHLTNHQVSLISALTFGVPIIFTYAGGMIGDVMISRGVRIGVTRKLITFAALGVSGMSMFALGMVDCDLWPAVIFLVASRSMDALKTGGYLINHLDIAPIYAGTVFGLSNCLSSTPAFIMPQLLHSITHDQPSRRGWRSYFVLAGAFSVTGSLVFDIYGTGKEQHWAQRSRHPADQPDAGRPGDDLSRSYYEDLDDYSRTLS